MAVVAAALLSWVALAIWVLAVPYNIEVDGSACSSGADRVSASSQRCDRAESNAKEQRRNQALLIGTGTFVLACAVSTWPSRRLTGDRLGPLR